MDDKCKKCDLLQDGECIALFNEECPKNTGEGTLQDDMSPNFDDEWGAKE